MEKITSIQIHPETRKRLKDAASKSETYDGFLNQLLDFWEAALAESAVGEGPITYLIRDVLSKKSEARGTLAPRAER